MAKSIIRISHPTSSESLRKPVMEASRRPLRAREVFLEWSEQLAANRGGALAQMADETGERAEQLLGRIPADRWGEPGGGRCWDRTSDLCRVNADT